MFFMGFKIKINDKTLLSFTDIMLDINDIGTLLEL